MQSSPSPKSSAFLRRISTVSASAIVLYGLSLQPASATVDWDGGAGTSRWLDAENWSTDLVPDDTSGTINIDGSKPGASLIVVDAPAPAMASGVQLNVKTGATVEVQASAGTMTLGSIRFAKGTTLKVLGSTVTYSGIGGNTSVNGGNYQIVSGTLSGASGGDIMGNISISGGGHWDIENNSRFGYYDAANISLSGGSFLIGGDVTTGRIDPKPANARGGKTNITITNGGVFSSKSFAHNQGTITVENGSFTTTSGNFDWQNTDFALADRKFKVVGAQAQVSIGGDFTATGGGGGGTREFELTAKNSGVTQENIATINVAGTDSAGGNVDVSLEGGILLANPTEYTLISAETLSETPTYTGTELYTGAADENDYKITLNSSLDQGDLTIAAESTPVSTTFDLTTVGYLDTDLSAILGENTSLLVRLDASAGTGTMEDLVAYLSNSGYSDFVLDAVGDYDIAFTIDRDYLSDGTMYLGWDLTDFASGAGLMGVEVTAVPEPNAIWLLSAAGLSLLLWRRRGSRLARRAA